MNINISKMPSVLSKVAGRPGLVLKKHSPELLVGVGVVGVVASCILACRATLKANDVLDQAEQEKESIRNEAQTEAQVLGLEEGIIVEPDKKEIAKVTARTGVKLVKLYAPSVMIGAASISCILGSHIVLSKRNASLSAAYMGVSKAFDEYRTRVKEKIGEEKESDIYLGGDVDKFSETEVDEESGKEKKVKRSYNIVNNPSDVSQYARFFDDTCGEWTKSPEYNKKYLLCQQNTANNLLKSQGHLFLNEVYDLLGMQRSQAGQIVGWVYDTKEGDGFVDFGIFDVMRVPQRKDFVNEYEPSILLDFNVDGVIYDLI